MSAILSRIFLWLFCLTLVWGLTKVFVEGARKRYLFNNNRGILWPGLGVDIKAQSDNIEMTWPDTTVSFTSYSIGPQGDTMRSSGKVDLRYKDQPGVEHFINSAALQHQHITLDTVICQVRVGEMTGGRSGNSISSTHALSDGRSVVERYHDEAGKSDLISRDTFRSAYEANFFSEQGIKEGNPLYSQGHAKYEATVNMIPSGPGQIILFCVWESLRFACLALMFFMLYRLFKQFSIEEYFNLRNAVLIRNFGILLIATEFLKLAFYYMYLHNKTLYALAINSKQEFVSHAQYTFEADISLSNIVFGCGMLVLSYVFLEAWRLQQEQKFTI